MKLTDAILARVRKLPAVGSVTAEGNRLEVALSDPDKQDAPVIEAIAEAGGHIQPVTMVGASLEDVCLKLVREGRGS